MRASPTTIDRPAGPPPATVAPAAPTDAPAARWSPADPAPTPTRRPPRAPSRRPRATPRRTASAPPPAAPQPTPTPPPTEEQTAQTEQPRCSPARLTGISAGLTETAAIVALLSQGRRRRPCVRRAAGGQRQRRHPVGQRARDLMTVRAPCFQSPMRPSLLERAAADVKRWRAAWASRCDRPRRRIPRQPSGCPRPPAAHLPGRRPRGPRSTRCRHHRFEARLRRRPGPRPPRSPKNLGAAATRSSPVWPAGIDTAAHTGALDSGGGLWP